MADKEVSYLIQLGIDKERAQQSVKDLAAIRAGIQGVEKQSEQATQALRRVAEQGAKLREVGATMAISGGALLAPFIAAANTYVQRYGQLESTSRKFLAAQQASSDATARLGRVAASQLTPVLNQVAAVQAKIAAFAEAHPEIAKAAIVGGAGLVAGGGALVMAGTAINSIAKAAELLKSSGAGSVIGGLAKAGLVIGAVAVASEVTVKGLNELGKATGDQRLASIGISDIFKTGRELIATAILEIAKGLLAAKKGFEDLIDNVATGFRDLFSRLEEAFAHFKNGLLEAIASILSSLGNQAGASAALASRDTRVMQLQGPTPSGAALSGNLFDQYRRQNAADLASRQGQREKDYQTGLAGLAPVASSLVQWAQTGTFQGPVGNAMDSLQKAFAGLTSGASGGGPGAGGKGVSPEVVNAFIQRNKSLLASERQYGIDRLNLQKEYQANELKAKQDQQAQLAKLDEDYQAGEAKAQEEFNAGEAEIQKKAAFDRQQKEKELTRNLADLAAARDVAGFVEAQKQHVFETQQQQAQDKFDAEQRKEQYNQQAKERAADYQRQRSEMQTQFRREDAERKTAYNNQLDALRTKHDQEKKEIDRAFAEQLAASSDNYAGLYDLQSAYYDDMTRLTMAYIDKNKSYLQGLLNETNGTSAGSTQTASSTPTATIRNATINAYSGNTTYATSRAPVAHGSFAGGLDYVPYDNFPALLHKGERVMTAAQNQRGGDSVSVTVQVVNPIGADQIEERATIGAVKGVRQAQELARARLGGN